MRKYKLTKTGIIILLIILLFSLSLNFYFITKKNNEVPYEQTYDYLFSRVESYPNNIIRTSYYGKDYFTIPVLTSCGVNDYVNIQQSCSTKSQDDKQ